MSISSKLLVPVKRPAKKRRTTKAPLFKRCFEGLKTNPFIVLLILIIVTLLSTDDDNVVAGIVKLILGELHLP